MAYNNGNGGKRSSFDPSKYETVKRRKERLRIDYPNSIIYPMQISGVNYANHYVVYISLIWLDKEKRILSPEAVTAVTELCKSVTPDNAAIVASSIGLLLGADSIGYSLSIAGGRQADQYAWVENCEESASGRALDNLGYHSGSASQEEMQKVIETENIAKRRIDIESQITFYLQQMYNMDINVQNVFNQCASAVGHSFNYLTELDIDELQTVHKIVKSAMPAA
ncbi:putative peptidase [Paenibacillus sp. TCA20]|uniref:Peptidase n=1 Tax=Paenibacillus urinalis TaxID=521520 RepID=A0ABY7XL40_9BACL|nr:MULTISPECIES: hypothetical protein [Paenibacillus]WDI05247.1 hypothetical protein PUW25_25905 [Paenibacillus urinalis]GAK41921.1 putative peptidase [Paenibacillus sp. TCA20]